MHELDFGAIDVSGDYLRRGVLCFERLDGEEYLPDSVFKPGDYDWPADYEGRVVLALSLLARAVGREPRYLGEILQRLPEHLNEHGYMGRVLPDGQFDEQQFSGHSWLLRGLCEHYLWKGDAKSLDMARVIAENLFLPSLGAYAKYPIRPEQRGGGGAESGTLTGDLHDGWFCSTDIGCAFIALDGVTQVYEITRDPRLRELVEAMIARFVQIDFIGITAQTHATLTALRSILRFCECTGDASLLEHVRRIYGLYRSQAMTENYENYNWFARPEWTEPCAVIDSFIVAVGLWKHTGERCYLDDAHCILFNGMGSDMRPSGGFGTNSCAGAKDEFVTAQRYEATWCCVMRGGEGLARAIQYLCFVDEDTILLPFYEDCTLTLDSGGGRIVLQESTGYPVEGEVVLTMRESTAARPVRIGLYLPPWADGASCEINGRHARGTIEGAMTIIELTPKTGDEIALRFDITPRSEPTFNPNSVPGHRTLRHGPLILCARHSAEAIPMPELGQLEYRGSARYAIHGSKVELTPLRDAVELPEDAAKVDRAQMLFAC